MLHETRFFLQHRHGAEVLGISRKIAALGYEEQGLPLKRDALPLSIKKLAPRSRNKSSRAEEASQSAKSLYPCEAANAACRQACSRN